MAAATPKAFERRRGGVNAAAEHVSHVRCVALVADTHGYLDPRVADAVAGCEVVVHAGDVGGTQVLDALQATGARVIAIRGNNDVEAKWPPSQSGALQALPGRLELELAGGLLVAVHGDRYRAKARHVRLRQDFARARAVLYGHSHRLCCDTAAQPWILNPGAAGRVRTYGGPSLLLLTVGRAGWQVRPLRFTGKR